ncbi:MAG TPA: hypothetical protein VGC28_05740 [Sphingomonas sp.]
MRAHCGTRYRIYPIRPQLFGIGFARAGHRSALAVRPIAVDKADMAVSRSPDILR